MARTQLLSSDQLDMYAIMPLYGEAIRGMRADHGDYEFVNRMGWQLYVAGLGYLDTRNWFARELLQQGEVQRRTDGKRMH